MMACALLVRMQFASSALAAVERYNQVRVRDLRGLTVVSQKKWVKYYEQLQALQALGPPPTRLHARTDEPAFVLTDFTIRNTLTGVAPPQLRLRVFQLDSASATKVRDQHGSRGRRGSAPLTSLGLLDVGAPSSRV